MEGGRNDPLLFSCSHSLEASWGWQGVPHFWERLEGQGLCHLS